MSGHVPVMLREALAFLAPKHGGIYLDATFGGGGYTRAILEAAGCTVFAIDRDPGAIARGAALIARFPGRLTLIEGRFGDLVDLLAAQGVAALDGAVFDFGLSSFQLDDPARGFSFRTEGPLDMRMGRAGRTAADLVNTLDEAELAALIRDYGEERHARRVARAIVRARAEAPIMTTARLAAIVRAVVPRAADGIDPATRSFQALRIAVNEELDEIARGLEAAIDVVSPGGRIVAVSFHSLEDRIVKRLFSDAAGRGPSPSRHDPRGLAARPPPKLRLLTAKPVTPSAAEIAANPRARSARLRAAEKLAQAA
ncbi:MAG: 16S rRNA (cytosine(1402)-N(4))-methyltransferase RsmH [Elioraea sp.]|nr:16S rRNA (cytosine(1402)-N(4))-methyltransferase RsmH [Elioraea sp.]